MVCYFQEISERLKAQQTIRESEERYRTLFNSMDEGYCIVEMIYDEHEKPVDYRFLEVNPSFEKQSGLSSAIGKRMRDLVPEYEAYWFETYGRVALTGEAVRFENEAKTMGRWFDVYACRIGEPESRKVAILFNNTTTRKEAEEQIKNSLNEKDVLLKEIHHRVKNNLQIISSLLKLQDESMVDKKALKFVQESQDRIQAMALIHEKLYASEDLAQIPMKNYIESLVAQLLRSYSKQIDFNIEADGIFLRVDTALPCGLILNELISNAFKHSFPGQSQGKVSIVMQVQPGNQLLLTIENNGVEISDDIDIHKIKSLGLRLVQQLVGQLEGSFELKHSSGVTKFIIRFPYVSHQAVKL